MAAPTTLAMEFLLGLHVGENVVVRDGQLYLIVPGAGEQPVTAETLDELETRGWLVPGWTAEDPDPPEPTEKGVYWLDRYMHQKYGKKR